MLSKISFKLIFYTISILVIASFSTIIIFFNYKYSKVVPPIYLAELIENIDLIKEVKAELPVRLIIEKIKVDSAIEYVGLTDKGAMDSPKTPDSVGWFNLGPRPGDVGSAVIAGHYGWKNNLPAVFDDLSTLTIGDKIMTEDTNGLITTFIVREIGLYKSDGDAANVFGSTDGLAHLNLITCEGIWSETKKSYSGRLIVFTDKELK